MQARPYLPILLARVANAPDFVLSEQEIRVTWLEFRDCPFNRPTIEFVDFKRVHAIEGQSNSPRGEVSVAATGGLASIAQLWCGRRLLQAPAPSPVRHNRSLVNAGA